MQPVRKQKVQAIFWADDLRLWNFHFIVNLICTQ